MNKLRKLQRVLMADLKDQYAILKNECLNSELALRYLNNSSFSRAFFKNTHDASKYLKDIMNIFSVHNLQDENFWRFFGKRVRALRFIRNYIESLGTIQKSLSERIDSLPPLYPRPPVFRYKEVFKAIKIMDDFAEQYSMLIADFLKYCDLGINPSYKNLKTITIWDYSVDDKVTYLDHEEYGLDSNNNVTQCYILIKASYWMMLMPRYLPMLAHEISHGYFRKYKKEIYASLRAKRVFDEIDNFLSQIDQQNNNLFIDALLGEIIVDIITLNVAGVSYLFSLFSVITKDPLHYRFYWNIQSFPFLRLMILVNYCRRNFDNIGRGFEDFVKEQGVFYHFFESYKEVMENPDVLVKGKQITVEPFLTSLTKTRVFFENQLFEIIDDFLAEEFTIYRNTKRDFHYNEKELQKAFCDIDSASLSLKLEKLELCGIRDLENIPDLLWYCLISHYAKKSPPLGRLNQEAYRLFKEKYNPHKGDYQFKLGKVIELFLMKVNWNSVKKKSGNVCEYVEQQIDDKLKKMSLELEKQGENKKFYLYNSFGTFDFAVFHIDYTVKQGFDWPIGFPDSKNPVFQYFPQSEVYQEILLDKPGYASSLIDFLERGQLDALMVYQIKVKKDTTLSLLLKDLDTKLEKIDPTKKLKVFYLKSFGWEDMVILFKGFEVLDFFMIVKQSFSELLSLSMTTFFYKSTCDIKTGNSRLISSATLSDYGLYKDLYNQTDVFEKNDSTRALIMTGLYDHLVLWDTEKLRTVKDLDRNISKFISDLIKKDSITSLSSRICFDVPLNNSKFLSPPIEAK